MRVGPYGGQILLILLFFGNHKRVYKLINRTFIYIPAPRMTQAWEQALLTVVNSQNWKNFNDNEIREVQDQLEKIVLFYHAEGKM